MTDMLYVLFGTPIVFVAACWLGRKFQRSHWLLDRPYAERVEALK